MLGVYEKGVLIEMIDSHLKISEILPQILQDLLRKYEFEKLIYANGPGSYMGIKISYISLQTLAMVKNIPLLAINAFELNGNQPIPANKHFCFVKDKDEKIILQKTQSGNFFMPKTLQNLNFSNDNTPLYVLEAVN
ncbi:tRNA threonylcarbamoyladenosine biosynthesis protein TsaB [Campylobacter insulaenigrae]|uniref:tRNA threonylcarbamoyladenosine biosynthesis protein TsaB n=1 Tax=Campylobacter insulaenigrae TaxID=260714 RepID=UPI002152EA27|nr:tRNA threonylcarbamoyladenosine biosynthesis protein TsaB [Campylobacter insulaenigrae]MCR6571020.1 tRNA threonylcarbamoyladenosine biosynthesis protein TsaB [Campylobacter insulaenigrae]MCR6572854.1 tRNA threonylcarbamoyladenosine biosynthesis protein TsaB [Campylobacter insulaenigrae]MCR6574484.1 tRNA threonylcarbamoyladenosine biosynthesis protein TsaB [Campylobacter insulaenigrae]MCR6576087.1 tRNA threonylcarbamoyladenosine biosynthesis protein TsaB [Campylobacter insulaenigrae]MCR65776